MASASSSFTSLSSSINSQTPFSFSTHFPMTNSSSSSSFSSFLSSYNIDNFKDNMNNNIDWGLFDHGTDPAGFDNMPKFKSFPPPSLPLSPPAPSPSSYLSIPPGLSPTEFLDSPVLFSTSNVLPSPTTGAFAGQTFNWRSNISNDNHRGVIRGEEKNYSDFSFQTQARPLVVSSSSSSSSINLSGV